MNKLFILPAGCPFCPQCEEAVLKLNKILPSEEKIQIIDILSGDPRTAILANLFKTNNPYDWSTPVLVIETLVVKTLFKTHYPTLGKRIIIHSLFDTDHYYDTLKNAMEVYY